jgi:hypothetical protein
MMTPVSTCKCSNSASCAPLLLVLVLQAPEAANKHAANLGWPQLAVNTDGLQSHASHPRYLRIG